MTSKEYLRQAYRLDHRINSDIEEMERLRDMAGSVSSPSLEERHNPNRPTEAPFVKCVIRGSSTMKPSTPCRTNSGGARRLSAETASLRKKSRSP